MALVTSIREAATELILDVYRRRRQIELAFKRIKSLFKYYEIPARVEASARVWLRETVIGGPLCETWVDKGRFSPSTGKRSG
ncbi:MAG: hypothetical protein LBG43_01055 [Treponema sp.]|nr:hypothetical protein [Treponema sp.]